MRSQNYALLSCFNKDGVADFAKRLSDLRWQLLASGGTAKCVTANGVPVRDIAELAGGSAILGHRVVTLSREVHAGLLSRDTPEDRRELERLGIPRIDLVCVDLYPLENEIKNPTSTLDSIIAMTDVGGPTLLHAAAKGQRIVICDPKDRAGLLVWLEADRPGEDVVRERLAAKAELTVSLYTGLVGAYRLGVRNIAFIDGIRRALSEVENPFAMSSREATHTSGADDVRADCGR